MLSLACSADTTWSSIDITGAFLNAVIHDDDTILATPPPILVKMDIVKPNTVWHAKKAIYGLREAPRLWQQERDQKLRDLEFTYKDKLAHLVQSHIHSSLCFIAEGPRVSTPGIPPFDHSLRSGEWTARLHDHQILGYVGVYNHLLSEQLEPNFKGGPWESTSFEDLCMLRRQIPKMDNQGFNQILPKDDIICVVQKTMGRRYIHMHEAAAWVLNGTHWFSLSKQPTTTVTWCRDRGPFPGFHSKVSHLCRTRRQCG